MLAAAVTLTLFGFVLKLVVDFMRRDGAKILAALDGQSWAAQPTAGRPVTIRFNQLAAPEQRFPVRPALRAAA